MINYNNRNLYFLFFNRAGSVLFSRYVIVPAILSTTFCGLILWQPEARRYAGVSKTVAQIYATIIGFAIVFRTNMAFGRYFEGVKHIQAMFCKWRDAFIALAVFVETSISKHEDNRRSGISEAEAVAGVINDLRFSKARLLHWFSLMCATAVQSIQHGRDDEVDLAEDLATAKVASSSHFAADPPAAEPGAPVLGSLSAECTDRAEAEQWRSRNRVQVLGQITPQEMRQISNAQEAVNLVMMWILVEVSNISITAKILTEPPILSRVYQELSNGMLAYFRAMQVECVPFPFPFAQVVNYTLYGFFLFCPFIVMGIIEDHSSPDVFGIDKTWPALLLNFFACAGYAAMNEIAIELEDPFGDDDNDYPIAVQQWAVTWAMEDSYFAPPPCALGSVPTDKQEALQVSEGDETQEDDDSERMQSGRGWSTSESQPSFQDRGPLGAKFRNLRSSVEAFVDEIGRQGREREMDCQKLETRMDDLSSSWPSFTM